MKRYTFVLLGMFALATVTMTTACKPAAPDPVPGNETTDNGTDPVAEDPPAPVAPDMTAMPVLLKDDVVRARFLANGPLHYRHVDTVAEALQVEMPNAVIDASPENLKMLVQEQEKLRAFTDAGGWLMLWGLTPDGLAAFNELVGVEHVIRQFATEEVSMPIAKDTLMSGMPHNPRSMVNGLTYDWRWSFLIRFRQDKPERVKWTIQFPRTEVPVQFSIMPALRDNGNEPITKIKLTYGKDAQPVELDIEKLETRQNFDIPAREATSMTIEIAKWDSVAKEGILGIMNMWIKVKRSPAFYAKVKPLLETGGVLMKYPRGNGGILLNQMRVVEDDGTETQKQTVLTQLVRNMAKEELKPDAER